MANELKISDVSVILPHFNAYATIFLSIKSIIDQSIPVKEIIIIDDCSSDIQRLETIINKIRSNTSVYIKLIKLIKNNGAPTARNYGVDAATGKYLAFLDADDVWHIDKIKIQYELMESKNIDFSGHSYVHNLIHSRMNPQLTFNLKKINLINFIFGNPFYTPTIMIRKNGFIKFDPRHRRLDDYKCWLMNLKYKSAFLIKTPLAGGFKPAIGNSGLTQSIKLMHESFLNLLTEMRIENLISLPFFLLTNIVEKIKYPLRIIKYKYLAN